MRPTGSELPDPESPRLRKACLTIFSLNSFSLQKKMCAALTLNLIWTHIVCYRKVPEKSCDTERPRKENVHSHLE